MRTRGTTLVEVLAATLILVVSIAGAYAVWQACFANVNNAAREHIAAELGRANVEKAKAMGFKYLAVDANGNPLGTYNAGTGIGTFIYPVEYYDATGNPLAGAPPSGQTGFWLQRTVWDYFVNPNATNTAYQLDLLKTVRIAYVEVHRLPDGQLVSSMGTNLVRGGL